KDRHAGAAGCHRSGKSIGSVLDEVQQFRPRAVAYSAMYHKDVALPDRLSGGVGVMINCREATGRVTALVPDEEAGDEEITHDLPRAAL
ncbi:hypothetical protein AB9E03_33585, partial [Rhizobium leguminosarum]